MKKFVTLLLTAALAVTAATTAFADTEIKPGPNSSPNPAGGDINVEYTVKPSYLVTIPTKVTLSSTANGTVEGVATVTASKVTVPYNQKVKVALNSAAFEVTSVEGAKLTCKVLKAKDAVVAGNPFLEVAPTAPGKEGKADLTFAIDGNVTYSGTYTGQVTFNVSVGN